MTINLNTDPYFDDYSETKDFIKIPFKPGVAVQARELTQIQDILQKQIERFGNHIFKEGSMVIPGEISVDLTYKYLKLQPQYSGSDIDTADFLDTLIIGKTSGASARVVAVSAADLTDPNTLFIKYASGDSVKTVAVNTVSGSNKITSSVDILSTFIVGATITGTGIPANTSITAVNTSLNEVTISNNATASATGITATLTTASVFSNNENIVVVDETLGIESATIATTYASAATGTGSAVTINDGIYFSQGYFLRVAKQTLILEKYSATPSYKVGLFLDESLVTASDDSSLNDPASGYSNFNAPGADRLKIELTLAKYALTATLGDGFIELLRIDTGVIQELVVRTQYSELEKTLARRTYDESGDYTVRAFPIEIREHLNDTTNRGIYTVAQGGDATKLAIGLEPGKAYVKGYEIEKISTTYVATDKGRSTKSVSNSVIPVTYGTYCLVNTTKGTFNISAFDTVLLKNAVHNGTDTSAGTQVGTAKVKGWQYVSGTIGSSAIYKLFLYDIVMTGSYVFATDVKSIVKAGTPNMLTDTVLTGGEALLFDNSINTNLVQLPNSVIKTVKPSGSSDTSYKIMRFYTGALTGGVITLTAGTNEIFSSYSALRYRLTKSDGTVVDLAGSGNSVVLGGSPTGKQVTITVSGGGTDTVRILATLTKSSVAEKTKTFTNRVQTGLASGSSVALDRADIFQINSIMSGAIDVTDRFTLDNGQRDNTYELGALYLKSGATNPGGTLDVDYDYFEHGAGDYFSVDSYAGVIDYADIPVYTGSNGITYNLRDCLDFRPRQNNTGSGYSVLSELIVSGEDVSVSYEYYLPRIDKVYLDLSGNFGVIQGNPSDTPSAPSAPDTAMGLYDVLIPPYTFATTDVAASIIENKRYTMRDIGKIEKRVQNLEYYVSLSLLEKETAELFIDDGTGVNRFKNGFVVDNFTTTQVADYNDADYKASIDIEKQTLRPNFYTGNIKLEYNASSSANVQLTGDILTLPYTPIAYITQDQASGYININPYDVLFYKGSMTISPSSDDWKDTSRASDVVITENVTNLGGQADYAAGKNEIFNINGHPIWGEWKQFWFGSSDVSGSSRSKQLITNSLSAVQALGTGATWERTGYAQISVSNRQVINDKILSSTAIPYMRSNTISFTATGLKPSTRVYGFFDGVAVDGYITPTGQALSTPMVTDTSGSISGTFTIPNTDTVRFRTGTKMFRLSDSYIGDVSAEETNAEAGYTASGILETRQADVISTRVTLNGQYLDPLAQSFMVTTVGGAFISKVDVFFASKDSKNIPVTLQIRNMVNGTPGSTIVPMSTVTLLPASVNTSTDGTVATTFTFEGPVYLQEGQEYAITLLSTSNEYNVWIATMGERQYQTDQIISKQPYLGVLFKSSNASTWTEDQLSDLKFTLYRCQFNTSVTGTAVLENEAVPVVTLGSNPLLTANASNIVEVTHTNHGMQNGDKVTLAGATATNNIPATELNASHTIANVLQNSYTITVTTNANATGVGGGTAITATENKPLDSMYIGCQNLVFNDTSLTFTGKLTTNGYVKDTTARALIVNDTIDNDDEYIIASSINETTSLSGNKSFEITGTFTSDLDNISPVIDLQRTSVVSIGNIINNDYTNEDTAVAGNALARYFTKRVNLTSPANALRVYFSALRPNAADIKVYYRILKDDNSGKFSDVAWTAMTAAITTPKSDTTIKDYEYYADSLPGFSIFAIKLVMVTSNTADVPLIKDFRAVATGS